MKLAQAIAFAAFAVPLVAQPTPPSPDSKAIFENTKAATVIVLSGEGAGRLQSIASGVIISKDGVILTALHAVKGAAEVQVRMANGDVFDRVELLGFDERRDIAALKISAGALPALAIGSTASLVAGDPVYAVTNASGLTWSATEGILSAQRPADEVPGAGSGFRLLQFTAPVAHGSSGGALVDKTGALIGIITSGKDNAAFAIPIENVLGLADSGQKVELGSGSSLKMPAQLIASSQRSAAMGNFDPKQVLKSAKTIYVESQTMFLTAEILDRALEKQKDWPELGIAIVQDEHVADLSIKVDRIPFTHAHTYVLAGRTNLHRDGFGGK